MSLHKKTAKTFLKGQEMVAKHYVFVIKKRAFLCFQRFFFLKRFKNERRESKCSDLFIRPFCVVLMSVMSTELK